MDDVPWPLGSLHDLRRTYGTQMARAVPMHVLKEYMGHADIKTTQSFYLAAETEDATRARQALDSFLGPQREMRRGRNEDAMGDSARSREKPKSDKPRQRRGLRSEADGTRTRNHRIDSPVL